jgi:hypothetical protein
MREEEPRVVHDHQDSSRHQTPLPRENEIAVIAKQA